MMIADMTGFLDPKVGTRIKNRLRREGVSTLEELLQWSERDLLDLPWLGNICLAQLTLKLKTLGFELRRETHNVW
jgi:DNA-directed RNA polymerase alpha subunit